MEAIGKEPKLLKMSTVDQCDMKNLFAKQGLIRIFEALNGVNHTTFARTKVVETLIGEQKTRIQSSVTGIDINISPNILSNVTNIKIQQPNYAIRKGSMVQLIKNGKKIVACVPNGGCLNYIEEYEEAIRLYKTNQT